MLDDMDVNQEPKGADLPTITPNGARWSVGGFLLGASVGGALMYVLDPDRGRRRRAMLRDRGTSMLRQGLAQAGQTAAQYKNRLKGVAAEARHVLDRGTPDDALLVARVRSALGHLIGEPGKVQVTASEGVVTLRGIVQQQEMTSCIDGIAAIHGAKRVENQLLGATPATVATSSVPGWMLGVGVGLGLLRILRGR
jgi:hyperosmotically inducible periplasmic protein